MLVLIEQTNHCGLQCVACPNRLNQRSKGVMTATNFKRIVDQIVHLKSERVALHGFGDVFLNPDFFENLVYLESKGFRKVDFSTNGLLLTEEEIKELCKFKCLNFISVSLNSSIKEQMEKINTGSSFEQVVHNTKMLLAAKPMFNVHIQHMIYEATKSENQDDFIRVLGSDNFIYCQKKLHNYYGQVKDGLAFYQQIDCNMSFAALPMMHWDGDLVGCCGDDTKLQIYGNALKDGIFSEAVMRKRDVFAEALWNNAYSTLPLCRGCVNGQT